MVCTKEVLSQTRAVCCSIMVHVLAYSPSIPVSFLQRFVLRGSSLVKQLAMGSVQFMGVARSAPLPPYNALNLKNTPSMAAGLPHFTTGAMRTWGRDTFIAYRGLLLVTERFQEAK